MINGASLIRIVCSLVVIVSVASGAFALEEMTSLGVVTRDGLRVRSDSRTGSDILGELEKGDYIDIVGKSYEWYKVRLPGAARVYVAKEYVVTSSDAADAGVIVGKKVNVRSGPSLYHQIVGNAKQTDMVTVLGKAGDEGDWFAIVPPEDTYGWVHSQFVALTDTDASASEESNLIEEEIATDINGSMMRVSFRPPTMQEDEFDVPVMLMPEDLERLTEITQDIWVEGADLEIDGGIVLSAESSMHEVARYKLTKDGGIECYLIADDALIAPHNFDRVLVHGIVRLRDGKRFIEVESIEASQ